MGLTFAIRPYNHDNHREQVEAWWEAHGWPSIPQDRLPPTGFIVPGVVAGWLYTTDGGFGWVEWVISNPESDKALRDQAIDALLERLIIKAKSMKLLNLFTATKHAKLIERYKRLGFRVSDTNSTKLVL